MTLLSIYKASAGSGKTFRLTGEYLKLIVDPENSFRSILAVTFTNKATAEMRQRILEELHTLGTGKNSAHADELKQAFKLTDNELKTRANFLLRQILHNYSRFNISTIDSFFQKILKAFTRETGLGSGYSIELNLKTILEHSIGLFFENINKNAQTKEWLSNYAIQKIEDSKSWDIEKDIYTFSMDAFNEVFFGFSEQQLEEFSRIENFKAYKKHLMVSIHTFVNTLQRYGTKAVNHIQNHQLAVADFSNGQSGVAGFLTKLQYVNQYTVKEPGVRALKALNSADGIEDWCTKTSKNKLTIQSCVNSGLGDILKNSIALFDSHYESFNTAKAILNGLDVFAVVVEVFNQMNQYCREKNIFLLPMASPLLSKMIGENDAPFIYEKTGEYLKYFMIDEFQDTSKIQWENFSPLFLNGISQNHESLVVGDVKQSIYRWRNGDWTLLNHKLANDFRNFGVNEINLEFNWRSAPEIINFNNWVFDAISKHAMLYMQNKNAPEELLQEYAGMLANIYNSAKQQIPDKNKNLSGCVTVSFCEEGKDKEENEQWYLNKMLNAILELLDNGVEPKDIAILVRRWKEGAAVAKHLMEYIQKNPERKEQLSFVSNDSVLLGSSSIILLLISLLEYLVNTENKESKANIIYFNSLLTKSATHSANDLMEVDFTDNKQFLSKLPLEFSDNVSALQKLPFPTLIYRLLNIFVYPNTLVNISQQLPFIHTFQDIILNFSQNNGSDISTFLNWWNEFGITTPINLSDEQNAIRIITIHKSKGLEYKAVIIPFANWSLDQLSKYIWCKTPEAFNHFSIVPIRYSSALSKTSFKNEYWTEKTMALIDNLNLLYVAFTRAVQSLYIFAPKPTKEDAYSKISDLIFSMLENENIPQGKWDQENFTFTSSKLNKLQNKKITKPETEEIIPIIKNNERKLKIRLSANDLFKDSEGALHKKVIMGNIYHKIMEQIITLNDIEPAVESMKTQGFLNKVEAQNLVTKLKETLSSEQTTNWFNGTYKILNESSILLKQSQTKRPDRVMIGKDHVIVLDYKFTSNHDINHTIQVKEYIKYVQLIENKSVEGFVWYFNDNSFVKVL
jgi:ATP-dependent exoDNAse (exonuclease V) beta subunit